MSFSNHFGAVAGDYAASRPGYPEALFEWLAGVSPSRGLAWDCGCGSGQASVPLAARFARVAATDASAEQIAQCAGDPRIDYRVAPADASGLAAASVDLVTVAQAMHWFDLARFYAEVRRVLRPQGVIAAWSYGILQVEGAAVDAIVQRFYSGTVGPYWPAGREHVEAGYRTLEFPFTPIEAPAFAMAVEWNLPQLLGYVRSWSSTARYRKANGIDPVPALGEALALEWGDPARTRRVEWPLAMLVGRP